MQVVDVLGDLAAGGADVPFEREREPGVASVSAPVRGPDGRVVAAVSDFPDSPINDPDKVNNWGNLVVIAEPRGWHVELSHFADERFPLYVERTLLTAVTRDADFVADP